MSRNLYFLPDTELNGFEAATLSMGTDFEGGVFCTLIRKVSDVRPAKVLLHVHGFNDYFFHAEAAEYFMQNGMDYYGLDLRKSGRSWREYQKFNNLRDINEYFADIAAAIAALRAAGAVKILLMGHSMGGLVTACYCAQANGNKLPDALFLNSPFLEQNKDILTRKLLIPIVARLGRKFLNLPVPGGFSPHYGPSLHISGKGEWSYNLKLKPHRSKKVNAGWVRAIYNAQNQLKGGISIPVPLLLMYPSKSVGGLWWKKAFHYGDAVVNVKHIRKFEKSITATSKTVQEVDQAKHDLFLSVEKVRKYAFEYVLDWARKNL